MTAEQAFPAVKMLIQQVQDSGERLKLENLILGAVEKSDSCTFVLFTLQPLSKI